ncbi:hypothetical protein ACK389_00110 [Streptomyces antibioticus]|uniref:hypothetical protein n=1 Tax=Streptomyces antibioticus TaxID=1890 RepID=UPI003401BF57
MKKVVTSSSAAVVPASKPLVARFSRRAVPPSIRSAARTSGAQGELEGVAAVEEEAHLGPSGQGLGGCLGQQRELDAIQCGPGGRQSEITRCEGLADRVGDHRGEQGRDRRAGAFAVDPAAYAGGVRGDLPVTLADRFRGDAAGELAVGQAGGRDPQRQVRIARSARHRCLTLPDSPVTERGGFATVRGNYGTGQVPGRKRILHLPVAVQLSA